ncbi:MAG: endonuclease III [Alkalispirochaetaceae bacterium]
MSRNSSSRSHRSEPVEPPAIEEVLRRLRDLYPNPEPLLRFRNGYELMVAVALSAQTTDAQVNGVTPELFRRFPDPRALMEAEVSEVEQIIHSVGFFRTKAKNIVAAARLLVTDYDGVLPETIEELVRLPGIGRKSAGVLLTHLFDIPAIIVDTHFGRVTRRLGYTAAREPGRIERECAEVMPRGLWAEASMVLNYHGRYCCTARKPECERCPLKDICPSAEAFLRQASSSEN